MSILLNMRRLQYSKRLQMLLEEGCNLSRKFLG